MAILKTLVCLLLMFLCLNLLISTLNQSVLFSFVFSLNNMDVTSETGVKYCTMVLEMTNSLTVEHSMYASKGKGSTNTVPSEAEASEK